MSKPIEINKGCQFINDLENNNKMERLGQIDIDYVLNNPLCNMWYASSNIGIKIGAYPILTIAAMDTNGNTFYFNSKDEKKVLKDFFDVLKRYDIVTGWNSKKFDIP